MTAALSVSGLGGSRVPGSGAPRGFGRAVARAAAGADVVPARRGRAGPHAVADGMTGIAPPVGGGVTAA
jgi:hypothetical protein